MVRLSICIPTYNRADELRVVLDGIAAQTGYSLSLEVAISDNASTDDTRQLVERYRAGGMNIVYVRLPDNRGFDRNLVNAMSIASGDYCWLFGSDDLLEPGAIASLEDVLARYPGLAGVNVGLQAYNADLSRRIPDNNQVMNLFAAETPIVGRDAIVAALSTCFGFISSNVVRRDLWARAAAQNSLEPYFKGYIHLYLLAKMMDDRSTWVALPQRLVGYRVGNDSFKPADEFSRTRLDIIGYDLAFGDTMGRDNAVYHDVMRRVATICISEHFMNAKLRRVSSAYWRQAIPTSIAHYWRYPGFWLRTLPVAAVPSGALIAARALYRRTVRPLRDRRRAAANEQA